MSRTCTFERKTRETDITVTVELDGRGQASVGTGVGFLDHLLASMVKCAGIDLTLSCRGDLEIDDHHTAEDCALALGTAIDRALGDRRGFARFGSAYAPMDETLARAVVDFSGRPYAVINLGLERLAVGALSCENIPHVIASMAMTMRASVHVDVLRGSNDHHRAEAAFKALGLSLRQSLARTEDSDVPSTKGVL
jgi:imidazoleglycerol phosphate dehydratase HisB